MLEGRFQPNFLLPNHCLFFTIFTQYLATVFFFPKYFFFLKKIKKETFFVAKLLFMPTEQQSQVEYYHYYRASQRRVRQWVQSTSRELEEAGTAGRSDLPLFVVEEDEYAEGGNSTTSGLGRGGSRRRLSSSSSSSKKKRQNHHDQVDSSRSRGHSSRSRSIRKKAKANDVRSRKPYSSDGLTTSSLLSLGLFPLIFALTPPSVATLFSATILLAGYFSVDYRVSIPLFYLFLRLIYFTSFRRSPTLKNCNHRGTAWHRLYIHIYKKITSRNSYTYLYIPCNNINVYYK